ncbi:MAG: transporter substrate-binding domain-containing protein, partial [Spirochaetales bacterium]|nr:transporter substrate-binding domain-containing protein [Spirochaetales bacterium]
MRDSVPPPEYPEYRYFTLVPGVTQEEIEAITRLQGQERSFVYGMNLTTECFLQADGTTGGFSSLFCQWLGNLFGMTFTPSVYEWEDLLAGLESGKIDFTGELTATEERRNRYFMTGAIAERTVKFMRIRGSEAVQDIAKRRPLSYAFLEGTVTYGQISPFIQDEFTASFVGDYDRAYRLMKDGSIDAFFDEGPAEAGFDIYGDVIAENFFPLVYGPVSLTTQNPDLAPIISVVQKALQNGASYHLPQLYSRGDAEYRRHKLYVQLDDDEKKYLAAHAATPGGFIPIAAEFDNYPVSFYNEQEKAFQGIAMDVLARIEDLTGLRFVSVSGTTEPWLSLLEKLERDEIVMVTELIKTGEREGRFIWPEDSYQTDYYALLSRSDAADITINEALYSRIGLITDTAYADIFHEWFPDHQNTIYYDIVLTAFDALEDGEIDLLMASRNLLLSVTNYMERPGFKVNMAFNHPYESFFGFNVNEKVLCSIVSKAQRLIDTQSIVDHWTRRVFDYRGKLAQTQVSYLVAVSLLLLLILILLTVVFLKNRQFGKGLEKLVKQRTAELEIQTDAAQVANRAKSEFLAKM